MSAKIVAKSLKVIIWGLNVVFAPMNANQNMTIKILAKFVFVRNAEKNF